MTAQAIDDVLAGTFPASDPPAWTTGIARPAPANPLPVDSATAPDDSDDTRPDVIDLSRPAAAQQTFANGPVSLVGAAGLVLLLPFALLAVITSVASLWAALSKWSSGFLRS